MPFRRWKSPSKNKKNRKHYEFQQVECKTTKGRPKIILPSNLRKTKTNIKTLFTAIRSGKSARASVGSVEGAPGMLRAGRAEGGALHEFGAVLGSLPC